MPPEPPVIFVRWEQFARWLLSRTAKFPRGVAYTFRSRIDNLTLDVFEKLIEARYTRERTAMLKQVNLALEKLRLLLRLCNEQAVLDPKAFRFACGELLEVGRMVGGWMRSSAELR